MPFQVGERVVRISGPNQFSATLNTRGKVVEIKNTAPVKDKQGYKYEVPLIYCVAFDNGLRECATEEQLRRDTTYIVSNPSYIEVVPSMQVVDAIEVVPYPVVYAGPYAPHIIIDDFY